MLYSSAQTRGLRFNALVDSPVGSLGLFVAVVILLQVLSIGCPIKFITGMSCPGCGLTRAWESALLLNFDDAARFHPLFWVVPFVFLMLAVSKNMKRRMAWDIALGAIAFCFVALWVIRLGNTSDFSMILPAASNNPLEDIVSWQPPRWWELLVGLFQR